MAPATRGAAIQAKPVIVRNVVLTCPSMPMEKAFWSKRLRVTAAPRYPAATRKSPTGRAGHSGTHRQLRVWIGERTVYGLPATVV